MDSPGARNDVPVIDRLSIVRYSHIFASAVREILEIKLLCELSDERLTLSHFHLLKFITRDPLPRQIHELAEFLGISPPAVTKYVDRLEQLGLVSRVPFRSDRRVTHVAPTEQGRMLVAGQERAEQQRLAQVFASFSEGELAQLARLLERFAVELLATEDQRTQPCLRCAAHFDDECAVQYLHSGCPYQNAGRSRRVEAEH